MTVADAEAFDRARREQERRKANGHAHDHVEATFVLMDDLQLSREAFWLIEDVLPRCSMVMLFGRGGCGKTYLMTSVAIGLAQGEWFGHAAERGAVLYCAFERPDDTEDRFAALRDRLGLRKLPIGLVKLAGRRLDEDCTAAIILAAKQLSAATSLPVRAVMIDTVAAALGGCREDDEGLGGLRLCGERIHAETGATVFWAHHEGKADNNGPRGHTTLADACMVWWRVEEREDGHRVVHVDKANRGPVYLPLFAFALEPFVAGIDKRGRPIELCEVQLGNLEAALQSRARERGGSRAPEAGMGANQKLLLDQLRKLGRHYPEGVEEALLKSHFLSEFAARRAAKGDPPLNPQQNAAKFAHTLRSLHNRSPATIVNDAGLWRPVA
jgi:hypothetical protein